LAANFLGVGVSQAGWKHKILIASLFFLGIASFLTGAGWWWLKDVSPSSLRSAVSAVAGSPVSWFVVIMWMLGFTLFLHRRDIIRGGGHVATKTSTKPAMPSAFVESVSDDDDFDRRVMAQWEPTHAYDVPIKLSVIDEATKFLNEEFVIFCSDADYVSRMWDTYINNESAGLLEIHLGNLKDESCRLFHKIESIRLKNQRYDDISGILSQDYNVALLGSLEAMKDAVAMSKDHMNAGWLISTIMPMAKKFREAVVETGCWDSSVRLTLLRRRRWLVKNTVTAG
jgi:hypothetical protein